MSTPFSAVYKTFLLRVRDYEILELDCFQREYELSDYLMSAVAEFERLTNDDILTIVEDEESGEEVFANDLGKAEIDILVKGMLYYWYSPKVLDAEKFENNFNLKDLPQYSPANLLAQLQENRDYLESNFVYAMNKYSFTKGGIEELKV